MWQGIRAERFQCFTRRPLNFLHRVVQPGDEAVNRLRIADLPQGVHGFSPDGCVGVLGGGHQRWQRLCIADLAKSMDNIMPGMRVFVGNCVQKRGECCCAILRQHPGRVFDHVQVIVAAQDMHQRRNRTGIVGLARLKLANGFAALEHIDGLELCAECLECGCHVWPRCNVIIMTHDNENGQCVYAGFPRCRYSVKRVWGDLR